MLFRLPRFKPSILIKAHDFGLGPTSILAQSLSSHKLGFNFFLSGNKTQQQFFQKQGFKVKLTAQEENKLSKKQFKAVISCFDPRVVIQAWKADVPSLYIDNLFWFWDFDKDSIINISKKIIKNKKKPIADFNQALNDLVDFNSHDPFVLGHLFSSQSLIQGFGGVVEKRLDLFAQQNANASLFGALVPQKTIEKKMRKDRPLIYVQLGGMLNPNTGHKFSSKYVNLIGKAMNKINNHQQYRVVFKVNPIFADIQQKYKNIDVVSTLSFADHISLIKNCDFLILQPGQNGIYESVYFKKKLFLLPEQTTSHTIHVRMMMEAGFESDNCMLFDFYAPDKNVEDVGYLYEGLKYHDAKPELLINKLLFFLQKPESDHQKQTEKRYQIVKKLLGDFNGKTTLVNQTDSFLKNAIG